MRPKPGEKYHSTIIGDLEGSPVSHWLDLGESERVKTVVYPLKDEPPAVVLIWGEIQPNDEPLVRIHSRCLYGEVFGSLDCDCKQQLNMAIKRIRQEGKGILIYLEQEGRGAGLVNKAKGYQLIQQHGYDTVEAYHKLGLPTDARNYRIAARILGNMGIRRIRLLTNNPSKVDSLVKGGLHVDKVLLRIRPNRFNRGYMIAKQTKLNHDIGITKQARTR
jgi:3,4-dihydroxy 2-butanone 4-phosphate synthase/GTP cyclohydrolase II